MYGYIINAFVEFFLARGLHIWRSGNLLCYINDFHYCHIIKYICKGTWKITSSEELERLQRLEILSLYSIPDSSILT